MGLTPSAKAAGGLEPFLRRTTCQVGEDWAVEMCYVCADGVLERTVEKAVPKNIPICGLCRQPESLHKNGELCVREVLKEVEVCGVCRKRKEAHPGGKLCAVELCGTCGKTRDQHPTGKFCERIVEKKVPVEVEVEVCGVCRKRREAHPGGKFCVVELCGTCGKTRDQHP